MADHDQQLPAVERLSGEELAAWSETVQEIARTLTLVREALGDPPEDLYEVLAELEDRAWGLASRIGELADDD
jgi:hypothetical protein